MCLSASNIKARAQWNWEGDTIIHDPIINAWRKVPGSKDRYDIDIREFISGKDNAVIRRVIGQIAEGLPGNDRNIFLSRKQQSFDLRLRAITSYILDHISYEAGGIHARSFDYWLFPEETLKKGSGDCEDRAFLLASLLLASGISSYSIRVALGKIYNQKTRTSYDHVWVMYKNESGIWMLIEPLLYTKRATAHTKKLVGKKAAVPAETVEYIPYYVFNDTHLWKLKNNTVEETFEKYIRARDFWEKFNPEFAAGVHNHLFDEALTDLSASDLLYVKAISLAMDVNPAIYDPRDHFDNGYIEEGWDLVKCRLEEGTLSGLARAAHAAADFYAHTSYEFFAKKANGNLVIYDRENSDACFANLPDYTQGGFDLINFSANKSKCDDASHAEATGYWTGRKILSGRFGQPGDQAQGFLEKVFISIPYALRSAPDFGNRTCLPHHNEIAVDDEKKPDYHKLYQDQTRFAEAFRLRKAAAVTHIKTIHQEWAAKRKVQVAAQAPGTGGN